ncbi:DUF5133 domain-containing protein [Streptomyces sp. NPDC048290]|uniref:DUF5133 domain-containing protein n=1 Tax=Streptomyces sp. NPDC048290 TaxID=3155811 RepID=UPI00341FB3D5
MPVAEPQAVRELLTRYAALRIAQSERERPAVRRELADVTRQLCATTGTADVHEAVARADLLLTAAVPGGAGVHGEGAARSLPADRPGAAAAAGPSGRVRRNPGRP